MRKAACRVPGGPGMCMLPKGAGWKESLRWNGGIAHRSSESKPDIEQPIVEEALTAPPWAWIGNAGP